MLGGLWRRFLAGLGVRVRQTKAIVYRDVVLARRSFLSTLLRVTALALLVLAAYCAQLAVQRFTSPGINLPISPVGGIPLCRPSLDGPDCHSIVYAPAADACASELLGRVAARNSPLLSMPPADEPLADGYDVRGFADSTNLTEFLARAGSRQYVGVVLGVCTPALVEYTVLYNLSTITSSLFSQTAFYDYSLELQLAINAAAVASMAPVRLDLSTMPFPAPLGALNIATYRFAPDFLFAYGLSTLFFIAQVAVFILCASTILAERNSGMRDYMTGMGVRDSVYFLSIFASHALTSLLSSLLACIMGLALGVPFFTASFAAVLLVLLLGFLSMTAFALFVATMLGSRTAANVVFMLVILLGGACTVAFSFNAGYWLYLGGDFITGLCSLFPPFNFARICADIMLGVRYYFDSKLQAYVRSGPGFAWADLYSASYVSSKFPHVRGIPPPAVSLRWLVYDVLIYCALAWYLDTIRAGKSGSRHPWFFPFTARYWGLGTPRVSAEEAEVQDAAAQAIAVRHMRSDVAREFLDVACEAGSMDDDSSSVDAASASDASASSSASAAGAGAGAGAGANANANKQQHEQASRSEDDFGTIGGIRGDAVRGRGSEDDFTHVRVPARAPLALRLVRLSMMFSSGSGSVGRLRDGMHAVADLTVGARPGQVLGLLGHNGAGKTTTIRMLAGLLQPTAGDAYIDGWSVRASMDAAMRRIGVCFAQDLLWPDLTASEHLRFWAHIRGTPVAEVESVVADCLAAVNLGMVRDVCARDMSGGMHRRLSVVSATIGDPSVLLLDEPSAGMDVYNRKLIWDMILRIKHHRTVLIATHSMDEADALCDKIAVLADGTLRAVGAASELRLRFGLGYRVSLTAQAHQINELKDFVAAALPGVCVQAELGPTMLLALDGLLPQTVSAFIAELQRASGGPVLRDWSLSTVPLEEVFLRVMGAAGHDEAYVGRAAAARDQPHTRPSEAAESRRLMLALENDVEHPLGSVPVHNALTLADVRSLVASGFASPPEQYAFLIDGVPLAPKAERMWRAADVMPVLVLRPTALDERRRAGVQLSLAEQLEYERQRVASLEARLASEVEARQAQRAQQASPAAGAPGTGGLRSWLGW